MCAFVAAVIEIDLVVTIEVSARRNCVCISIPKRPSVVGGIEHAVSISSGVHVT